MGGVNARACGAILSARQSAAATTLPGLSNHGAAGYPVSQVACVIFIIIFILPPLHTRKIP